MSSLRLVYDQENENLAVVEHAQRGYAVAVQAIRDNYALDPKLDALLGTMQTTFDNLAALAKVAVQ